jgi:hypothetical protein
MSNRIGPVANNTMPPERRSAQAAVAPWLWSLARWSFAGALLLVAALAAALSLGLADPPHAGPLQWEATFAGLPAGWTVWAAEPARVAPGPGGLVVDFPAPGGGKVESMAAAITAEPSSDFTLEVAGGAQGPGNSIAYGLVFGWRDSEHYSAVLVNADGYAQAYRQAGPQRAEWFPWQQWPHILGGADANRVRVDARGAELTLRVNDEILVRAEAAPQPGQVGVLARGAGPGEVIFYWAKLWANEQASAVETAEARGRAP